MTDRPLRIAVVDDEPNIGSLVENVLTSNGYEVVSTTDPRAVLELVREARPDLVLCDIAMPGMDGYAVLKALQGDPDTASVPVVFLTANQEFSERVRAFRYGVVDYLAKPFTTSILVKKVERIFDSLRERRGVVTAEGPVARDLVDEMKEQARSGVLTLEGEGGESRMVLRAGEVVSSSGAAPPAQAARARFEEIDAAREDILANDPPSLPQTSTALPEFDDIPEVLRRVLVVDDNRVFRTFVKDLLTSRGFTVYEATDGASGLRLALEKRPWLILTDVRMPGEDGFEFCRKVRRHSLIRQIPLLFLSGWDDYKARYLGLELGADDFVSKETPVRELLIRIQLILKRYMALGRGGRGTAMEGSLEVLGAPGVLQVCHLTRLTGTLNVESGARHVEVRLREGEIAGATGGSRDGVDAIYELLSWEHGRFHFAPGDPGAGPGLGRTFNELVLEGCRQLDELRRSEGAPGAGADS